MMAPVSKRCAPSPRPLHWQVRELMAHGAQPLLEATFIRWVARRRRGQVNVSTVLSSRQHEARLLRAAAESLKKKCALSTS